MKRKWELIAQYCHEKGYSEAGELAEEIDGILDELYEMKIAPDMKGDYERHVLFLCNDRTVRSFANGMKCCVACVVHNEQCSVCEFAEDNGACTSQEDC